MVPHDPRVEQLLEPVKLYGIVEDDARNGSPVGATVRSDHLGAETLDQFAANSGSLRSRPWTISSLDRVAAP
jgi:hypothetical protein